MQPRPISLLATLALLHCASGSPGDTGDGTSTGAAGSVSWDSSSTDGAPTSGATTDAATTDAATTDAATIDAPTTDAPATDASSGEPGTSSGDATTGGPDGADDEALLRQAIAGEVDPADALTTIAGRGGLPVQTGTGGFLFACLCGQGTWSLVGAHNGWVDAPMATTGPLYWAEVEIAAPDGSLYKFHDADNDAWIADPLGRRYGFDENGRYSLVRASAAHLERWYGIADATLEPRNLQVYVPEDGVFTHALYAHDGQNLFNDPDAPWGGWQLQATVPPEMLIVGIDNTPARIDEYTHVPDIIDKDPIGGEGEAYADFIDGVVRPRMEAAYGEAEVVGTMGSSLGGLIALVIADRFPERYDMAISLSATAGWGSITEHNQTIIERYAAAPKRDFAVYLDSGGNGPCADADMDGIDDDSAQAFDNYCENAQLLGVLQDLGYSEGVDLWYVHDAGAMHNEAAWAARVDVPLDAFASLP